MQAVQSYDHQWHFYASLHNSGSNCQLLLWCKTVYFRCDQEMRGVLKKKAYATIFQAQFNKNHKVQFAFSFFACGYFQYFLHFFSCSPPLQKIPVSPVFFVLTFSCACLSFPQLLYKKLNGEGTLTQQNVTKILKGHLHIQHPLVSLGNLKSLCLTSCMLLISRKSLSQTWRWLKTLASTHYNVLRVSIDDCL